jgi:hypothetical protein
MSDLIGRNCQIVLVVILLVCVSGCSKKQTPGGVAATVAQAVQPVAPEPRAIYLTVRLRPDVDPEILRYLAEVTEPSEESVTPGTPLKSVLKKNYGFDRRNITEAALEFNPGGATRSGVVQATELKLPPGPLVTQNPVIKPHGNLTVKQLVQAAMGTSGERTRTNVLHRDGNEELQEHWDDKATADIQLPYAAHYTSYRLKTKSMEEARRIAETVKKKDRNKTVLYAEVNYDLMVTPSWKLAGSVVPNGCSDVRGDSSWPFKSLPKNWSSLDQSGPIRLALVAILDTGLADGLNDRFPLWENAEPGGSTTLNEFAGLCVNDVHGCNFVVPATDPVDDCTVTNEFHHGTHIAGLASARLFQQKAELDKRLELMIVKIADSKAHIEPAAVLEGARYALTQGAKIINLSLAGSQQTAFDDAVKLNRGTLFVAAAGNPGTGIGADLDQAVGDHSVGYPARLSRDAPNLIAVAAHDGSGKIDCFSNYGAISIDLAAPGFDVRSIVSPADDKSFSGTSQATALVSLAAAILYSQGITAPSAIKHRLIASTDFSPALSDKVFSSGILNIENATAFKHDILQFDDFHVVFGEVLAPLKISVDGLRNDLSLRGEVLKILPKFPTDHGPAIRVTYLREGRLVNGFASRLDTIRFKSEKGIQTINPSELIDIIPARIKPRTSSAR